MIKYMVAPSYQNAEIIKINEETKKAYIKERCDRCGGTGIIVARVENGHMIPIPVDGGICYKCHGDKFITKWVKAYTEEEYTKYEATQKRNKEKKEKERNERIAFLNANSENNKKEKLAELGYDVENPKVYCVIGDNTYAIKDELKAAGAHFNPVLNWYFTHESEVPEGYSLVAINFDEIFDWSAVTQKIFLKDEAKEKVEAAILASLPESPSEWIGEIKERIRDIQVEFTGVRSFDGFYGTTYMYFFLSDKKNVLVWTTSSFKDLEIGAIISLTGTVKDHKTYKNIKQTYLSRCILKQYNS